MEDKQTGFQCAVKKVGPRNVPELQGLEREAGAPVALPPLSFEVGTGWRGPNWLMEPGSPGCPGSVWELHLLCVQVRGDVRACQRPGPLLMPCQGQVTLEDGRIAMTFM